jgi:hypothetical protein
VTGQSLQHQQQQQLNRFQLVKQDEMLADLIAENLLAASPSISSLKNRNPLENDENSKYKGYSTNNRLINKNKTFIKDWEVVNLQELESKLKQEIEIENEYKTLPILDHETTILKEEHLRKVVFLFKKYNSYFRIYFNLFCLLIKLNVNLIPRAVGYRWVLSFSTELNGFSLTTLYRLLSETEGPCLVVVKDTNNDIFGTMTSSKLMLSEHFYGTGESFLFTFYPEFKVFKWTGENNFFIRGTVDSIGFGCGEYENNF